MPSEWRRSALGDVLTKLIDHRGRTPRKLGGEFVPSGIRAVSAKNMKDGRLDLSTDVRYVTPEMFEAWMPEKLRAGDVLLTSEAPLGEVAFLKDDAHFCLSQRLFALRANPRVLDGRFLYYTLRSAPAQARLSARATGTTAEGIRQSELVKVEIDLPPLPVQRSIARILGALDDKIELNRKMNETLEQMARAVFKAWFVDFEPFRDKGLVETELGRIPKGWRFGRVDEDFDLTMGQSPPGETYNESGGGVPFYQGRTDFGFRFPTVRVFCSAPTRMAKTGDTLVSVRAPVGSVNMASGECAVGRGVAAVRHKSGSRSYTYYFMRSLEPEFARFEAEGTVFGSINKDDFHAIKRVAPPSAVVEAFERTLCPFDQRIGGNEAESRTLAAIRDALLPKLMSGEVKVEALSAFA